MNATLGLVAAVTLGITAGGCGGSGADPGDAAVSIPSNAFAANSTEQDFCDAMAHLIVLLAPEVESSPAKTHATFAEAAVWFEQANATAPAAIVDDFAAYKAAYDEYARFLSSVDFNLDTVFSTPDGRQLAIDTSHTLTSAIVQHVVGECGLSFGDEQHDPASTS